MPYLGPTLARSFIQCRTCFSVMELRYDLAPVLEGEAGFVADDRVRVRLHAVREDLAALALFRSAHRGPFTARATLLTGAA